MTPKELSKDEIIERYRVECNNYTQSVFAIKAMANALRWDGDAEQLRPEFAATIGQRMRSSDKNRISPDRNVTPDLVVASQVQGYLVEAKVSMSPVPQRREKRLLELQKYDDELVGWPTSSKAVDRHDIVLLVHLTRAFDVISQLKDLEDAGRFHMERCFSVIGFMVSQQRDTYLALELRSGVLSDGKLMHRLQRVLSVPMEHLYSDPLLGLLKLYDADPPLPYLMQLIHETIVNTLNRDERDDLRDSGILKRPVTLNILRKEMAERWGITNTGDGVPEVPQRSWLVDAFDAFRELGWAEKPAEGADYLYIVKQRRQPMEQFLSHCADMKLAVLKARRDQKKANDEAPLLSEDWLPPIEETDLLAIAEPSES